MREFAKVAAANLEKLFKRKFEIESDEPSNATAAESYNSDQDDGLMKKKMERDTTVATEVVKTKKPKRKKATAAKTTDDSTTEHSMVEKKPRGKKAKVSVVAETVVTEELKEPISQPEPVDNKKTKKTKAKKLTEPTTSVEENPKRRNSRCRTNSYSRRCHTGKIENQEIKY
jgi:hypothetical protein